MNAVIPLWTTCDAGCPTMAQSRVTILSLMLPIFLCGHCTADFCKKMDEADEDKRLDYMVSYNVVEVAAS